MRPTDEMKRRPSGAAAQSARILDALREGGWLSGRDFRWPTIDGGGEIPNITPRIAELRKRHHIASERGPDGCARYRLSWDRGDDALPFDEIVADARAVVEDAGDQLALEITASPSAQPARSAIYDDAWDTP